MADGVAGCCPPAGVLRRRPHPDPDDDIPDESVGLGHAACRPLCPASSVSTLVIFYLAAKLCSVFSLIVLHLGHMSNKEL